MASLVGSRVERKEDKRFLTGKGRYTADINISNQTYAYFVRSPHARAKINKIEFNEVDYNGIAEYLSNERSFSRDRVDSSLNRLKKSLEKKSHTLEQWFN